jgi:MazG family protein
MTSSDQTDYVAELAEILARLRAPEGCPWDREQTHDTLKRFLIEEAGELLDAIDEQDDAAILDELGDVLLQIVFHAQIAAEEDRFNLQDVARSECEKMIRRHPHVFGDASVDSAEGVIDQWDVIKRRERGDNAPRSSAVHGVPRHLPALHRAQRVQSKAAKVGFEWPSVREALAKIREELAELEAAVAAGTPEDVAEEVGDLLFAVVNVCRYEEREAEDILQQTIRKFEARFRTMEHSLEAAGRRVEECPGDELLAHWNEAKTRTAGEAAADTPADVG